MDENCGVQIAASVIKASAMAQQDAPRRASGQPTPGANPDGEAARRRTGGPYVLALMAVAAALLCSGFGYVTWQDYRQSLDRGWVQAESAARLVAGQTEAAIDTSRLITQAVIDQVRVRGLDHFRHEGRADLVQMAKDVPAIGSVWVLDANCRLVASNMIEAAPPTDYSDRPYCDPLRGGDDLYIGELLSGRVIKVWFFSYTRAIRVDGTFLGIVLTSMHADYFAHLFELVPLGANARISVYRRDGPLVMRWPLRDEADAQDRLHPDIEQRLPAQLSGRVTEDSIDGARFLHVYQALDRHPLVVTVSISRAGVLQEFRSRLTLNLAFLIFSLGAVALLGGLALREARRKEEGQARLRTLVEALPQMIWTCDPDGSCTSLSRQWVDYTGRSEDEQLGLRWVEAIHPDDRPPLLAEWRRAVDSGTLFNTVARIRGADGHYRWFKQRAFPFVIDRKVTGWFGSSTDITDLMEANEAVRESEERFRLAAEAANQGLWDYDIVRSRVFWNETYDTLFGPRPMSTAVSGEWWFARIHDEDRERVVSSFQAALEGGSDHWECEYRFMRPDGRVVHVADRAFIARGPDGRASRMVGYMMDLTERKQAEERHNLLVREVNHRAKNALAVVQALVRLTPASRLEDFVPALEGRISALARAHNLLAAAEWSGVPMRQLILEELVAYKVDDRVRVNGPDVMLDARVAQPLGLALHELATNAAKYGGLSRPAGSVSVTWTAEGDGTLHVTWEERGGPPVNRPERTGFGSMLIERCIRAQLGGALQLDWNRSGLRCSFSLPADTAREPAAREPSRLPPAASPSADAPRILIVEDEALIAMELKSIVEDFGCQVLGPFARIEPAISMLAELRPDAAILDLNIGGTLVTPLAAMLEGNGVPFVICTGYGDDVPDPLSRAPVLGKPIEPKQIVDVLRSLLVRPAVAAS